MISPKRIGNVLFSAQRFLTHSKIWPHNEQKRTENRLGQNFRKSGKSWNLLKSIGKIQTVKNSPRNPYRGRVSLPSWPGKKFSLSSHLLENASHKDPKIRIL